MQPAFTTVGLDTGPNQDCFWGEKVLRAVGAESVVSLDGHEYAVGGMQQQSRGVHSMAWINHSEPYSAIEGAFSLVSSKVGTPVAPFPWQPGSRHAPTNVSWPPKGVRLVLTFEAPGQVALPAHAHLLIDLVFELYQGFPAMTKQLLARFDPGNPPPAGASVEVSAVSVELLNTRVDWSPMDFNPQAGASWQASGLWSPPGLWPEGRPMVGDYWNSKLLVQADIPHSSLIQWQYGPQTTDSINTGTPGIQQPVLNATYLLGPGVSVTKTAPPPPVSQEEAESREQTDRYGASPNVPRGTFASYRPQLLFVGPADRERFGLLRRKLTRLLAPAAMENPLYLSVTDTSQAGIALAAQQAADIGFDMLVYSFGSGFNMEDTSPSYMAEIANATKYARSLGLEVGGYDLIVEDRGHGGYGGNVGDQWDVVDAGTGALGADACFASGWYDKLVGIFDTFLNATGITSVITDGPYGGSHMSCSSTNHSHHNGLADSVYMQTQHQVQFFKWLLSKGVYILQPDYYFFSGAQKSAVGYNEQQYSLGRWMDLHTTRLGLYWDLEHFIPSQGWAFVPLVQYHAGGAAAAFEPLSEHLPEYSFALGQYLSLGIGGNWRGARLYDTPEVREVARNWVQTYRNYSDILQADVVRVQYPTFEGLDCQMHVDPFLRNGRRAIAAVFNPTAAELTETIKLPTYYTGLQSSAVVAVGVGERHGKPQEMSILDGELSVPVTVGGQNLTWIQLAEPGSEEARAMFLRWSQGV